MDLCPSDNRELLAFPRGTHFVNVYPPHSYRRSSALCGWTRLLIIKYFVVLVVRNKYSLSDRGRSL